MALFQKAEPIRWTQLTMPEHIVMLAMTADVQKDVEWSILRGLCFHGLAVITPKGLKLTHLGRRVIAQRHGLPVVVGRDPNSRASAH
ncbi:hypothetical protein [Devosia sp.]|uniref:hypothetical protein n=1 Tax=Devosia sp. TaxID=1871048 RepID=UPI0025D93334|nr:hypothetical protein [Devosia sp.]MCR6635955.1 hypothetical protein [Devosia sp.]